MRLTSTLTYLFRYIIDIWIASIEIHLLGSNEFEFLCRRNFIVTFGDYLTRGQQGYLPEHAWTTHVRNQLMHGTLTYAPGQRVALCPTSKSRVPRDWLKFLCSDTHLSRPNRGHDRCLGSLGSLASLNWNFIGNWAFFHKQSLNT